MNNQNISFNLLTKPWIPTQDRQGTIAERGILDVLREAHMLRGVTDPAPPVEFGIIRFLVAFITDLYQVKTISDMEDLLDQGQFDSVKLEKYAVELRDRFDLFDPVRPFYQVPAAQMIKKKGTEPVARLFQHLPAGNFHIFFTHTVAASHAFSPAVCARALCTIPPFMTPGGAGYYPSVNKTPPWYVVVEGRTLYETLVLNICGKDLPTKNVNLPPAWKAMDPTPEKVTIQKFSTLQGLTWQARRISLIPSEGGNCTYSGLKSDVLIREIMFGPGPKADGPWTDPNVAYVISNKGPIPIRPQEDRASWRDIGPLMLLRESEYQAEGGKKAFNCPAVVQQFTELRQNSTLPEDTPLVVTAYGIRTDMKMKIFEWLGDRLALPKRVATQPNLRVQVQRALDLAEYVNATLRAAISRSYPRNGQGAKNPLGTLKDLSSSAYWEAILRNFKMNLIETGLLCQDINDPNAPGKLEQDWKRILLKEGSDTLELSLKDLDSNAKEIERAEKARGFFQGVTRKKFFPPKDVTELRRKKRGNKTGIVGSSNPQSKPRSTTSLPHT